jgi:hypothetical protein
MFVIAGPRSPALLINVLVGIELHVDWHSFRIVR